MLKVIRKAHVQSLFHAFIYCASEHHRLAWGWSPGFVSMIAGRGVAAAIAGMQSATAIAAVGEPWQEGAALSHGATCLVRSGPRVLGDVPHLLLRVTTAGGWSHELRRSGWAGSSPRRGVLKLMRNRPGQLPGPSSQVTRRWREHDSNQWSPLGKTRIRDLPPRSGNRVQPRPRRGAASSDPFINCPADRQDCGT